MNDQKLIYEAYVEGKGNGPDNNYGFSNTRDIEKIEDGHYKALNGEFEIFSYQNGWMWKDIDNKKSYLRNYYTDNKSLNINNLHRLDGPACETVLGKNPYIQSKEFWIHGKQYKEVDYWIQPEVLAAKKVKPENRADMVDLLDI